MIDPVLVNIISATVISVIITAMSVVKNAHLKALIYSLPIPITVALIATGGIVNTTNVIGLALLSGFLWLVHWLRNLRLPILVADAVAALLYVFSGYLLIGTLNVNFWLASSLYLMAWGAFMLLYNKRNKQTTDSKINVSPVVKAVVIFFLALILFSLKSSLAGIIVTFPFSGVFAVVEGKDILRTLAATFTRNSLAILLLFLIVYLLTPVWGLWIALSVGWVSFTAVITALTKLLPIAKK